MFFSRVYFLRVIGFTTHKEPRLPSMFLLARSRVPFEAPDTCLSARPVNQIRAFTQESVAQGGGAKICQQSPT
jgi:hypothetical protein